MCFFSTNNCFCRYGILKRVNSLGKIREEIVLLTTEYLILFSCVSLQKLQVKYKFPLKVLQLQESKHPVFIHSFTVIAPKKSLVFIPPQLPAKTWLVFLLFLIFSFLIFFYMTLGWLKYSKQSNQFLHYEVILFK